MCENYNCNKDTNDPEIPVATVAGEEYDAEVVYFVYERTDECFDNDGHLYSGLQTYIWDNFPWLDGYMPKGDDLSKEEIFIQSKKHDDANVKLTELIQFGWIGYCTCS